MLLDQPRGIIIKSRVWSLRVEHWTIERPEPVENRVEMVDILDMHLKPADL
jgi:hypothetical protein